MLTFSQNSVIIDLSNERKVIKMTVKEFYDYAVKNGLKNAEIVVNFECSDDYYSIGKALTEEDINWSYDEIDNKEIFINIS
jgi:site-specific recombinase XerD